MSDFTNESLIDMYIFETTENIEQIERTILSSEESELILLKQSMKFSAICIPLRALRR